VERADGTGRSCRFGGSTSPLIKPDERIPRIRLSGPLDRKVFQPPAKAPPPTAPARLTDLSPLMCVAAFGRKLQTNAEPLAAGRIPPTSWDCRLSSSRQKLRAAQMIQRNGDLFTLVASLLRIHLHVIAVFLSKSSFASTPAAAKPIAGSDSRPAMQDRPGAAQKVGRACGGNGAPSCTRLFPKNHAQSRLQAGAPPSSNSVPTSLSRTQAERLRPGRAVTASGRASG
jgi:hypothetical protein